MNHQQAREWMADALSGQIQEQDRARLDEHLASCLDCRREMQSLASLWDGLAQLHTPGPPSDGLNRLLTEMKETSPGKKTLPLAWAASIAAVFLLGALAGYLLRGTSGRDMPQPVPAEENVATDNRSRYLLVLRQPETFTDTPESDLVGEYMEWGSGLGREGRLEAGEKLREDGGRWVQGTSVMESPPPDKGIIAGYFIVRASNYEEAVRMTSESPHIRYGGVVEIREIDPLD